MADLKPTAQENTSVPLSGTPFADKTGSEKITWLGKAIIMLISGGFAFPNIFTE